MAFWSFYAGHGVMQNQSHICLNTYLKRFQKHEFWLDTLANIKNCAVFGFFDACRETKSKDDILKYNNAKRVGSAKLDAAIKAGKTVDDTMLAESAAEIAKKEKEFLLEE